MKNSLIIILISIFTFFEITLGLSQNYSLEFDGNDDYVVVNNNLGSPSQLSGCCWVKFPQLLSPDDMPIIANWSNPEGIFTLHYGYDQGVHHMAINLKLTGGHTSFLLENNDYNIWLFICFTFDGDTLRIYKNGEVKNQKLVSGTLPSGSSITTFGTEENYGFSYCFEGNIDEVSLWDIEITQQQIQNFMCTPPSSSEPGLKGLWLFNEGSGTVTYDSSLFSNNGTLMNGTTWSTDIPSCSLVAISISATPDSICVGDSSQLNVQPNGGVGTVTYQWTSNPPGYSSDIQNPVVYPDTSTWYIVTVSDNDTSLVDSVQVSVDIVPSIYNIIGGGSYCEGGVGVDIGLDSSEVGISYELYLDNNPTGNIQSGTGSSILFSNITQVGDYTIFGYNNICSEWMNGSTTVSILTPYEYEEICMVTVDTNSVHNMIIWNKTYNVNTSSFIIYKESTQSGVYFVLDTIPFLDNNLYVDLSSNPLMKADRYKISVLDSCDNESDQSPFHKTIHLTINSGTNGWNLIWSHYVGFDFGTYYIWRKDTSNYFSLIDSVQSNLNSYTDIDPPSGDIDYKIMVKKDVGCTIDSSKSTSVYFESYSNISSTATVGLLNVNLSTPILFYNQNTDELTFKSTKNNSSEQYTLNIIDIQGRIIETFSFYENQKVIHLNNLKPGTYIIRLTGSRISEIIKIIKSY